MVAPDPVVGHCNRPGSFGCPRCPYPPLLYVDCSHPVTDLGDSGQVAWQNCPPHTPVKNQEIPSCQQVWWKKLSGAATSVALLFINYAPTPVAIKCDSQCLANAGISSDAAVRDLWSHKGESGDVHFSIKRRKQHDFCDARFTIIFK